MFRSYLGTEHLSIGYLALSGAIAGTCQVVATNPMEIVKIRMQMSASSGGHVTYGSIIRDLGISGLYTSFHATLLRYVYSLFTVIGESFFTLFRAGSTSEAFKFLD